MLFHDTGSKKVMQSSERRMRGGSHGEGLGTDGGMSEGREDECLRSFVMSGDGSPVGMILLL